MEIVPVSQEALTIGQLSNNYAASNVFDDYQSKVTENTLKRQRDDIKIFSQFLKQIGMKKDNLMVDCTEWNGITFGLVEAFKRWQVDQGYAIASINAHLSTVKVYAKLAAKAGTISAEEYAMIKMVSGYRHKEGRNVVVIWISSGSPAILMKKSLSVGCSFVQSASGAIRVFSQSCYCRPFHQNRRR